MRASTAVILPVPHVAAERVITGDLVSVPRVTDMWSPDKPALRERETEEGRDRAVALHTRWAVVSVL